MQMHRRGKSYKIPRKSKNPLSGQPFMKGVVLKTIIKKPKKPNSANRKCVIVRLSNGKEMTAYVPGKIRGSCLQQYFGALTNSDGLNYFQESGTIYRNIM